MDIKYSLDVLDKAIYPKHSGYDWIEKEKDTEYSFFIGDDNKFYLCFQGSLSVIDWLYNLLFFCIPAGKYFVHYGLYKKYKILEDEVINFMLQHQGKEFVFTGHSQGAAIALIAMIYNNYISSKSTAILFGCPKIFNIISAIVLRKFKNRITLFETINDIVPKVVPTNGVVGTRIKLGEKKSLKEYFTFWKWMPNEHYPKNYRKLLKAKLDEE